MGETPKPPQRWGRPPNPRNDGGDPQTPATMGETPKPPLKAGLSPSDPPRTSKRTASMQLRAEEISQIIKKQIQNIDKAALVSETGTVLTVGDGIARIHGLSPGMAGEVIEFTGRGGATLMGLVLNLEQDNVGSAIFGDTSVIKEGDSVKRTGRIMEVPVGEAVVGRVVN